MLTLILFLGVAISGVLSQSGIEACVEGIDLEDMKKLAIASTPGQDELDVICPQMIGVFDCIGDFVKKQLGVSLEELVDMAPDSQTAKAVSLLVNVRDTLKDLCTEGSELNTAYKEHSECFDSIPDSIATQCEEQARTAYNTYKGLEDRVQEEAGDNANADNAKCMHLAYTYACLGAEIHEKCGQDAFEMFKEVIKRTTIFKTGICTEDDLGVLKSSFLDKIDLEEGRKDLFRVAFDLRKRRK